MLLGGGEPLEIDQERSWESYKALAYEMIGTDNMGEWGSRVGMDIIQSHLFDCWMREIDYYNAVLRLREKLSEVS